mmetsp:Transcript_1521/g.3243  ORF Transcript_1521/g.3243 Transcript_1521/m.3243 type:complete len:207 (-) Transcript_1521:35-655(-)
MADNYGLCARPDFPEDFVAACIAERLVATMDLAAISPAVLQQQEAAWQQQALPTSPSQWAQPPVARTPGDIVETLRRTLEQCSDQVACVEAKHGPRGWNVIAYVRTQSKRKERRRVWECLIHVAKEALLYAAGASDNVFLLGYDASPFMPMSMGFGCAAAVMPDETKACWATYSKGFCDRPGSCGLEHPKSQVAINVQLKHARAGV